MQMRWSTVACWETVSRLKCCQVYLGIKKNVIVYKASGFINKFNQYLLGTNKPLERYRII